jgi:hypothetical protein
MLVIAAWWTGHRKVSGWLTLYAGIVVELTCAVSLRRSTSSTPAPGAVSENSTEAARLGTDAVPAKRPPPLPGGPDAQAGSLVQPPSPAPAAIPFTTCVLLRTAWEPSADVFLASLRRGGLRETEMAEKADGPLPIRFHVGPTTLELLSRASPIPAAEIEYAASQSWEWPDASAAVSAHTAHVLVTTRTTEDVPRADIVRLHRRAHAALAEFAPVLGVMWRDAGRLLAPSAIHNDPPEADADASLVTFCVTFRMFPPSEARPGQYVSDSVGLHAFGLSDVQIATVAEPDETVSIVLYRLVDRFFAAGCEIQDGNEVDMADGGRWRATRCRAVFAPDREVIELVPVKT